VNGNEPQQELELPIIVLGIVLASLLVAGILALL